MTTVAPAGSGPSRLVLMQSKFQQKQLQEKEEKLLKLYETQQQRALERVSKHSGGSGSGRSSGGSSSDTNGYGIHAGRVRQMFQSRRNNPEGTGICKSHPLEPIRNKKGTPALNSPTSNVKVAQKTTLYGQQSFKRDIAPKPLRAMAYNENSYNYDSTVHHNDDLSSHVKKLSYDTHDYNDNYENYDIHTLDDNFNNVSMEDEGFPNDDQLEESPKIVPPRPSNLTRMLPSERMRLEREKMLLEKEKERELLEQLEKANLMSSGGTKKTSLYPKKPPVKSLGVNPTTKRLVPPTASRASPITIVKSSETNIGMIKPRQSPQSSTPSSAGSNPRGRSAYQSPKSSPSTPVHNAKPSTPDDNLEGCRFCNRRFASDRLSKHQEICMKTKQKKRKPFDVTKHRVAGTDAEAFVLKKGPKPKGPQKQVQNQQVPGKKSDWRKKHEDFIETIRAAKQAQAYVAAGGKLSDLPPPPPSYNPDYVQCPHCQRKFNQQAADRHIPKCSSFQFNKPKRK